MVNTRGINFYDQVNSGRLGALTGISARTSATSVMELIFLRCYAGLVPVLLEQKY